jgi:uncharacterized damage-inducible protein DinB
MNFSLAPLFDRDIERLYREIEGYPSDELLWELRPGIGNAAGTLVLHLCGNLNHFIGATLGNTGYVRDRDAEFSTRDISKADLLKMIEKVKLTVLTTLESLTDEQLNDAYPLEHLGYPTSTNYFLVHLNGHLNYHLGQVNYHRRLL